MNQFIKLIVVEDGSSSFQIAELLKASHVITAKNDGQGNLLIFADSAQWARANHKPQIRMGSINREHWGEVIDAVLDARSPGHDAEAMFQLPVGDFWCFLDGGMARRTLFQKSLMGQKPTAKKSSAGNP